MINFWPISPISWILVTLAVLEKRIIKYGLFIKKLVLKNVLPCAFYGKTGRT